MGVVPDDVPKSQVVVCVVDDDPDAYSVTNTDTMLNMYIHQSDYTTCYSPIASINY